MIAARQIFFGGAAAKLPNVVKSMCGVGGSREGFCTDGLSIMPMPITMTMWFKNDIYTNLNGLSKSILKYGNISSGVGFGQFKASSNNLYQTAAVVEARYWASYSSVSTPTDYAWHHLALIVKSGTNPLSGAVYIDGVSRSYVAGGGSDAIVTPTGAFSICGRAGGYQYEDPSAKVLACRVCIFNGEMSAAAIAADMALGAKAPKGELLHYYDGTLDNGMLMDLVGNWHLTATSGSTIENETPWS